MRSGVHEISSLSFLNKNVVLLAHRENMGKSGLPSRYASRSLIFIVPGTSQAHVRFHSCQPRTHTFTLLALSMLGE